jgi:hypothetical protein
MPKQTDKKIPALSGYFFKKLTIALRDLQCFFYILFTISSGISLYTKQE